MKPITTLMAAGMITIGWASAAEARKKPQLTSLELQQIQSRDFETSKNVAFAAVMTVLQDAGYRIGAADRDTGIITGTASTKTKMTWLPFVGFGTSKKTPVVSAFVEEKGRSVSRVRLSFVMGKIANNNSFGGITDEDPINDPTIYREAFEKIAQAIFVRQSLDAAPAQAAAPVPAAASPQPSEPVASTPK